MSFRLNSQVIWTLSTVLVLTGSLASVKGQYTTEEYAAYQAAVEAAPGEREKAILGFVKDNPESMLVEYAVGSYLQLMQEYQNEGKTQQVFSAGEGLLEVAPDDLNALYMTSIAAYQLQNFDKAVTYGEKVYSAQPNSGLAFVLASSYSQLQNDDKLIEYGEVVAKELAPADSYQVLSAMARVYATRKQWETAAKHAENAITGLDKAQRPASTSEAAWKTYVNGEKAAAYAILGRQAAETKQWKAAVANYKKVLSLSNDPAFTAEAYYFTGMARWDERQMEPAMQAFAKGSVQKGAAHAGHCREYLETLYKSTHNDSLAGLEEYVARVTRQ